jgi:hypothetical protein
MSLFGQGVAEALGERIHDHRDVLGAISERSCMSHAFEADEARELSGQLGGGIAGCRCCG